MAPTTPSKPPSKSPSPQPTTSSSEPRARKLPRVRDRYLVLILNIFLLVACLSFLVVQQYRSDLPQFHPAGGTIKEKPEEGDGDDGEEGEEVVYEQGAPGMEGMEIGEDGVPVGHPDLDLQVESD